MQLLHKCIIYKKETKNTCEISNYHALATAVLKEFVVYKNTDFYRNVSKLNLPFKIPFGTLIYSL